jgi:hypothetical protein
MSSQFFQAMQELIDANKEDLPTDFVANAMTLCQEADESQRHLYRIGYVYIDNRTQTFKPDREGRNATVSVRLIHRKHMIIAEAVAADVPGNPFELLENGMIHTGLLTCTLPMVMYNADESCAAIIHLIVPCRKREGGPGM